MSDYQPPKIIASHRAEDLVADAASCAKSGGSGGPISDIALKQDVTPIDRPLGGFK